MDDVEKAAALASLKVARASGVLNVRQGDESVTYRSLAEIDAVIGTLEGELTPKVRRPRVRYFTQKCKGL